MDDPLAMLKDDAIYQWVCKERNVGMPPRDGFILIAEDDEILRDIASEILKLAGYRTICASNGDIAMVLLSEDLPIHTLFTDIVMPGTLDGFGVAEKAIAMRPGLKVLYTSGFNERLKGKTADLLGPFLPKPYHPEQLLAQIELLLDGVS